MQYLVPLYINMYLKFKNGYLIGLDLKKSKINVWVSFAAAYTPTAPTEIPVVRFWTIIN